MKLQNAWQLWRIFLINFWAQATADFNGLGLIGILCERVFLLTWKVFRFILYLMNGYGIITF